jgi:hypothetical protein
MNWGKGIIIAMLAFMGFIGLLIALMVQHGDGLEEASYYEKGNRYGEQLDKLNHAAEQGKGVKLGWDDAKSMLRLVFQTQNLPDSGALQALRPSDMRRDFAVKLIPGSDTQYVSWEGRPRGNWKLKCDWYSGGKAFLIEKELMLP